LTRRELNQLYHLNREIEQDKQRLRELESAATNTNSRITGMPHAAGISDKTSIAVEIAYLRGVIENKIQRTFYEYNRLINYINGIDDSFVRQVLTLRHINGLTWFQISQHIGGGNTESCVKMAYHRYLTKSCDDCDGKS
jgi:hypothetical protein